jgi:hypothetical protein
MEGGGGDPKCSEEDGQVIVGRGHVTRFAALCLQRKFVTHSERHAEFLDALR